jgi:membrane-associated phospholipid phosphatase
MPRPADRTVRWTLIALAALAAALLIDTWAYHALAWRNIYDGDFGRMLRVMGFVPLWAMAGLALVLHDWQDTRAGQRRSAFRRGGLLLGASIAGGLVAELLKLLLRRERPWAHDGEWVFRSFTERPFSSGGLALPSSHALVAFAAAAMLARLFPRAAPVWYTLAAGCGFSRVAAGAHFVSDIVVAAIAGWLVVALIWHRAHRAAGGRGPDTTLQSSPGSSISSPTTSST